MKQTQYLFLATLVLCTLTPISPLLAEEPVETEQEIELKAGPSDEIRDAKLMEEAEKRWKSKPRHSHTLEDAKKSAMEGREHSPRYLLRDAIQEEQMKKNQDALSGSAQESHPPAPLESENK